MADNPRDDPTDTLAREALRPRLIAVWTGGSTLRPLPDRGTLVMGRGAECDVRIDHGSVSRTHAALHVRADNVLSIEDLGSSNGTRVHGRALTAGVPEPVTPADIIEVGGAKVLLEWPARRERSERALEAPMGALTRLVDLVAPADISVVLQGETGVGKGVIAEKIHQLSPRSQRSMVRLNCATLSDSLLESELFGHERGAFTGATQAKLGLLEAATGGTVFLDEVAELPPIIQAKLLHVLESGEVLRVGALKPRPIDVRFIAATNRDLRSLCDKGAFRSDLYFRLNGITITLPPLRDRVGEISLLAQEFIKHHCAKTKRTPPTLTHRAIAHLEHHAWPGNVRELRNVIERALVLCPDAHLGPEHLPLDGAEATTPSSAREVETLAETLPPPPTDGPQSLTLKEHLGPLEQKRIVEVLAQCGGNQTKAARLLGISRRTLVTRLDAWRLPRPRK